MVETGVERTEETEEGRKGRAPSSKHGMVVAFMNSQRQGLQLT